LVKVQNFAGKVWSFLPATTLKMMWTDSDGDSGAGLTLQHHSLHSYGGHEMVQQHHTLWNVSKKHQFCPNFDGKVLNFLPATAQRVIWTDSDGESGAGLTLQHHSLDSYGGHEMFQQHHTLWNVSKNISCPPYESNE
jgi:Na+-transporting NADH:ubiquinone oxidoreductase subunit NqrB